MSAPLDRPDRRRIAGNLLTIGLPGPELDAEAKELLREIRPFGVILFARNIVEAPQLRDLTKQIKAFRPDAPIVLSVDQEGGRVQRLRTVAQEWPTAEAMAAEGPQACHRFGQEMGRELRSFGFDLSYAPVLDIHTEPANPIIGDRAFGTCAESATRGALAYAAGLTAAGILTCGKHFPGHGDTTVDSHLDLPVVPHDLETLVHREWRPFHAAAKAGMPALMTAHLMLPELDPEFPATLSRTVLELLRSTVGFQGIIVSDDIDMKALSVPWSIDDIASRGLTAGLDHFLACQDPARALALHGAIHRFLEQGVLPPQEIKAREARVLRYWHARTAAAA